MLVLVVPLFEPMYYQACTSSLNFSCILDFSCISVPSLRHQQKNTLSGTHTNLMLSREMVPVKHIKRVNILTTIYLTAKNGGTGKPANCTTMHLLVGKLHSLTASLLSYCCQMLFTLAVRTVCINND